MTRNFFLLLVQHTLHDVSGSLLPFHPRGFFRGTSSLFTKFEKSSSFAAQINIVMKLLLKRCETIDAETCLSIINCVCKRSKVVSTKKIECYHGIETRVYRAYILTVDISIHRREREFRRVFCVNEIAISLLRFFTSLNFLACGQKFSCLNDHTESPLIELCELRKTHGSLRETICAEDVIIPLFRSSYCFKFRRYREKV